MSRIKSLIYNIAQLALLCAIKFSTAKTFVLEWARGTGKSTIIAKYIIECVTQMPRSTGGLVGATFAQIKTRTLPSTIQGLEQHGLYLGIHFFVGQYPPKEWKWPAPHQPILDPKNCIFFWNGTVMVMISLDGGASSGRGLNLDWAVGDEAALFDKEKFATDVEATIRGNLQNKAVYPDGSFKFYKQCRLHHSMLLATSTPITNSGMWILDYELKCQDNPNEVQFLSFNAVVNIMNLGIQFFKRNKSSMPDFLYDAEILNRRIRQIKDGFYPRFNESIHTYTRYNHDYYRSLESTDLATCEGDLDLEVGNPLYLSMDWGGNINCLIVAQRFPDELRLLKDFFVLSPKILDDVLREQFIPYYSQHMKSNNKIYMFYDPSGNNKTANSRVTFAQQAKRILEEAGWQVQLMTRGVKNESHENKYRLLIDVLSEETTKYPRIRINKFNARNLVISIQKTPAKRGVRTAIQKDKSSERKKTGKQEHATHFSDTFDLLIVGLYMRMLNVQDDFIPGSGVV